MSQSNFRNNYNQNLPEHSGGHASPTSLYRDGTFGPHDSQRGIVRALPIEGLSPSDNPGNTWNIIEYWRTLLRFKFLIGAITLGTLILGTLYAFLAEPRYTAGSTVRVESYQPLIGMGTSDNIRQELSQQNQYLETQLQEIMSLSLADRVLDNGTILHVIQSDLRKGFFRSLFGGSKASAPERLNDYDHNLDEIYALLDSLSVRPVRRTNLVELRATYTDPEIAALMANQHARSYIDWVRDVRVRQQSRGLQFLEQQALELRTKVADLERELADYAEEHSIVALNKDENVTLQKMSQLNKLLTDATAKRIEAERIYGEAEKNGAIASSLIDDDTIQNMRTELSTLKAQYSQLAAKFLPSYPKMKQLSAQIEGLKSSIAEREQQLSATLKSKADSAAREEENLKEELEQQKSKAFELSKHQVEYNILDRELTSSRELLQNVEREKKALSLSVESNASNVDIVDLAVPPVSPSFPNKPIILILSALVGLGAGTALALLLGYLDNTVHTPDQASELLQIPNLGVVPHFQEEEEITDLKLLSNDHNEEEAPPHLSLSPTGSGLSLAESISKELLPGSHGNPILFQRSPQSLAAEAYRTIRTGILLSQAGEPPKTILVTSAQPSEGKTTLSTNLAACLASAGGKVVVVDADLRRPSVWNAFNADRSLPGLTDILTGQASISDVVLPSSVPNVSLLLSGRVPPNPAELVGSMEMANLLRELEELFDFVIVDSPPILPVTDSVLLSRYVDGVLLVVRGNTTPKPVIRDAKERISRSGARVLGSVLNDIDIRSSHYRYYHRYYYSSYEIQPDAN